MPRGSMSGFEATYSISPCAMPISCRSRPFRPYKAARTFARFAVPEAHSSIPDEARDLPGRQGGLSQYGFRAPALSPGCAPRMPMHVPARFTCSLHFPHRQLNLCLTGVLKARCSEVVGPGACATRLRDSFGALRTSGAPDKSRRPNSKLTSSATAAARRADANG